MRGCWIIHPETGQLIPKHLYRRPPVARSDLAAPMVIRDFQDAVFSHADGRHYTSKKHWRDHLRAHNMVELGNERPKPKTVPALTAADIAEAYDQCEAGKGAKLSDKPPEPWEGSSSGEDWMA